MIVVQLMGGLGNQMFQYAAGRSLALRLGVPLKLDLSFYEQSREQTTPRQYALDSFTLQAEFATPADLERLAGTRTRLGGIVPKLRCRLGIGTVREHCYREPHFHYDPTVQQLPDDSYLIGFWQSERYFGDDTDGLKREFRCRYPMDELNQGVANDIDLVESVAVHIRRGDYISNQKTASYHGVCSLEYYQQAASVIAQKLRNPHFFMFTDDPDWVAYSFRFDCPCTLVTCNRSGRAVDDLRLMSRCRHAIIANSSFSWWGAWLNSHRDKLVIAPKRWFAKPELNTEDLIPPSWITL